MDKEKKESTKESKDQKSDDAFKETFERFCRFGERESDGKTITLRNIDKWMKQAKILGGKSITSVDTGITFSKIAKTSKRIDIDEFQQFLELLAADKKMESQGFVDKLVAVDHPSLTNVTRPISGGAVGANLRRMTDATMYTGMHKERFDEEGRGRGIEGREDVAENSGYVSGYKNRDTYSGQEKEDDSVHKQNKKDDSDDTQNKKDDSDDKQKAK